MNAKIAEDNLWAGPIFFVWMMMLATAVYMAKQYGIAEKGVDGWTMVWILVHVFVAVLALALKRYVKVIIRRRWWKGPLIACAALISCAAVGIFWWPAIYATLWIIAEAWIAASYPLIVFLRKLGEQVQSSTPSATQS